MSDTSAEIWTDLILAAEEPAKVWGRIFARLKDLALATVDPRALHSDTAPADRLLAESAWNLWESFSTDSPRVTDGLKEFWTTLSSSGTAVLILDGLSLRELPLIAAAADTRGIKPTRIEVRGVEVPTETEAFATTLGLSTRSKLYNNKPPASFIFGGPDTYCDVLDAPFQDCISHVPHKPRVFLWHKWPDEPLIHLHEDKEDADKIIFQSTKAELASDGFWKFLDRLRQGRRLVITADHGYATRRWFTSEVKDEDTKKLLREVFGRARSARENPEQPWPTRNLPPLVLKRNGWLAIMGQRWWTVQGGYPFLCHRGLTLLEAAVPFIELPPM